MTKRSSSFIIFLLSLVHSPVFFFFPHKYLTLHFFLSGNSRFILDFPLPRATVSRYILAISLPKQPLKPFFLPIPSISSPGLLSSLPSGPCVPPSCASPVPLPFQSPGVLPKQQSNHVTRTG